MRRRARIIAALIGGTAGFAPAAAQQIEVPPDTFTLRPTVRFTYDSNILRLNDQRDAGPHDDFRATPGVDLTFRRRFGRHQLSITGTAGYDFYKRFSFLNRERIDLSANGVLAIGGRCRATPGIALDFQQAQLSDQGIVVGNTERIHSYEIDFDCRRSAGFYPNVGGKLTRVNNSASVRKIFDLSSNEVHGGIGYIKPSLGDIRLNVSYEQFRRPRLRDRLGINDSANRYAYGLRFNRNVAPRVSFRAGIDYLQVRPRPAGVANFSGVGFLAGAQIHPSPRLNFDLDFERTAQNQSNTGATYIIQNAYRAAVNIRPSARSRFIFGASYVDRNFKGELDLDNPIRRGSDRTWAVYGDYRYALFRNLELGIGARREQRRSDASFYNYKSSSVTFLISSRL
jgi:hypothetical protein